MTTLSRPARPSLAEHRAEREAGVVVVAAEGGQQRGGVVEQAADVDAGERGRHQAERRQRAVAAADVRVGQEDSVAGLRAMPARAASPGR